MNVPPLTIEHVLDVCGFLPFDIINDTIPYLANSVCNINSGDIGIWLLVMVANPYY